MKKSIKKVVFILFTLTTILQSCTNDDLKVSALPTAAFQANTDIIKLGDTLFLNDKSFARNGSIATWDWNFGNGEISDKQSPFYVYPEIGEYTVSLSVEDEKGNKSENTFVKKITVYETSGTEPETLWSYEVPYYSTNSSIAFFNNTVFVVTDGKSSNADRGDNILAIKQGELLWSDVTDEVIRMTPAVNSEGVVYVGDYNGILHAYNTDGTVKWSVDLGKTIKYSSPAIAEDGTIYIGLEDDNKLYAINPTDGSTKWSYSVENDIRATPVIDSKGTIYLASSDDNFYAINKDGTLKWKTFYGDYTSGTPAISEKLNRIYLTGKTSDNTGHLIAFNLTDGTIVWDNNTRLNAKMEQGGPAIAKDGTIYAGGEDNKMVAYNTDGTIKWEYETFGKVLATPALDNRGNLYFGDTEGYFYVVNSKGNNEWAKIQLNEEIRSSALISEDGTIYILTRDNTNKKGKVFALQTDATGLLDSEWPMLSKNTNHTGQY